MPVQTTQIENGRLARLNTARKAVKTGASLATGGIGRTITREAEKKVKGKVIQAAERFGGKKAKAEGERKLVGPGFWFIFTFAVVKEIFDIFLTFTFFLSLFTLVNGLIITFVIWVYLASEGVSGSTKNIAVWIVSLIIEFIPFLNILPTFPISLLIMRTMENNEFLKEHAEKIM